MIVNQLISISLVLVAFGPGPADAAAIDPELNVITAWTPYGGLEEVSSVGGDYSAVPVLGDFPVEHNSTALDRRAYCGNIPRGADCCISEYLQGIANAFSSCSILRASGDSWPSPADRQTEDIAIRGGSTLACNQEAAGLEDNA